MPKDKAVKLPEYEIDSDDARERDAMGVILPETRPKRPWFESLKDIDLFGIQPGYEIEEKQTFKTWWGACFSMMAILSCLYYAYSKSLFFYDNNLTYFVERIYVENQETGLGNTTRTFEESNVFIEV